MKKFCLILVLLLLLLGCQEKIVYDSPQTSVSDMSGYGLQSEQFYTLTIEEFLDLIAQKKTIIVYFGYEGCPWCTDLLPILNEVSIEKGLLLYYIDFHDEKNMNDIEGLEKIEELAADLMEEDEQGQLKLYFPTVYYVQKGTIIQLHQGTVSGHDASLNDLTEKQKARLKYNLEKEFDNLFKE
ncbi:MAG: thioredoxin family protein [Erysipelotrichia bacterium]|nr:thioredoxin family protein [Erysipelotrichia bacterium]